MTFHSRLAHFSLLALLPLAGCRKNVSSARGHGPGAVPVLAAAVEARDTPLVINAIGRVMPLATVSIKPQVTGQISQVNFTEGQEVKTGDLLFTIDKRPFEVALARAQASLDEAAAGLRNAEKQAARYTELSRRGAVAKEQFDQIALARETSAATVKAAEAAVKTAELQLEYCTIRSPISGRTGKRLIDPGNVVTANETSLAVVNQIEPIQVAFPVAERYLTQLEGYLAEGNVTARATPQGEGAATVEGPVTFLDNAVKAGSGTVELKATFENRRRTLWPGQFVRVEMQLSVTRNAVVIPGSALQNGQEGPYVFVIAGGGTAEYRRVKLERMAGESAVIGEGLRLGERIVTDGQSRLAPGIKVEIKGGHPGAAQS